MNNCVLMAEVVKAPELRYLQDGQTTIAEMVVQFPALRSEDPMETVKVLGWGNLAQQIQEQFQPGDQLIIEGRLNMILVDRPEGFKEKRAELTAGRIHRVQADLHAPQMVSTPPATSPAAAPSMPQPPQAQPAKPSPAASAPAPTAPPAAPQGSPAPQYDDYAPNYDDIPF
jgi:single-strand DNA-binding protein